MTTNTVSEKLEAAKKWARSITMPAAIAIAAMTTGCATQYKQVGVDQNGAPIYQPVEEKSAFANFGESVWNGVKSVDSVLGDVKNIRDTAWQVHDVTYKERDLDESRKTRKTIGNAGRSVSTSIDNLTKVFQTQGNSTCR